MNSAIGERQMLPWQTNIIFIILKNSKLYEFISRYAEFAGKFTTSTPPCCLFSVAYDGIDWHIFTAKSSKKSSKNRGFLHFYYSGFLTAHRVFLVVSTLRYSVSVNVRFVSFYVLLAALCRFDRFEVNSFWENSNCSLSNSFHASCNPRWV